jgi:hypothetical protein
MVLSSQEVFLKLLLPTPEDEQLSFDVLALAVMGDDGNLDHEKLRLLIRVFRPERDGKSVRYHNI